ncbi:MAG: serine--tRNA ligase [Candidatus Omnitrophica bacterium]|nr:serine--tRNA ligase [Candidatus Omnitrophota bacterium]
MLDIKFIRENPDIVKKSISDRGLELNLDELLTMDEERRKLLNEVDELKHTKNIVSDEVGKLLNEKKDAKDKISKMKVVSQKIDEIDKKVDGIGEKITKILYIIPNIPHSSIPVCKDPSGNKVVKEWGKKPVFDFKPRDHMELAANLDIIDFPRATKISGGGFVLYKKAGARLERALINFMLDLHTKKHGYTEIFPPFLVNRQSMTGTGQLPKLEEDMYRLKDDDLFLVPTAEVPVTNIFRDEILKEEDLPIYYTAYTACFRREAGSYGKDTKGLSRVHQFDKVELVKFVKPETSYDELEKLRADAEEVLQLLGLSYRVVMLCTGDISFAASKCYDLELWAEGSGRYFEVSSCSNFEDFQARRANIKYRPQTTDHRPSTRYIHTLNGSGVALARLVIAILETYQEKDGSVIIPEALRPYMDYQERIKAG